MQNLIVGKAITGHGAFGDISAAPALRTRLPPSRDMTHGFGNYIIHPSPQQYSTLAQGGIGACERPYEKKGLIAYVTVNRPSTQRAQHGRRGRFAGRIRGCKGRRVCARRDPHRRGRQGFHAGADIMNSRMSTLRCGGVQRFGRAY